MINGIKILLNIRYLDPNVIDIHVNLLFKSTTDDYSELMRKINSRKFYSRKVQKTLEDILGIAGKGSEFLKKNLKRFGLKGGRIMLKLFLGSAAL